MDIMTPASSEHKNLGGSGDVVYLLIQNDGCDRPTPKSNPEGLSVAPLPSGLLRSGCAFYARSGNGELNP